MGYAVIAAVVVFTLLGLSRWADIMRRHRAQQERAERGMPEPVVDASASPRGRVRQHAWFAAPVAGVAEFARTLGLRTVQNVPLETAATAAREGLFVVKGGNGRVLAIGIDAFARGDFARIDEALCRLSLAHGEAVWFGIDEDRDLCGWARAHRGEVLRAFCWDGSDDELLWEIGEPSADERSLGFFTADPRDGTDDEVKWWPLPREVRALAQRWGAEPAVGAGGPDGGGLAGRW